MAQKRSFPYRPRTRLLAVVIASCFASAAYAFPTGPQIAAGSASFSQAGNVLTIDNSANAILNWQKFSIAASEAVRFNQPSASSSVLNRVLANDPSSILGQLSSNGRVWLVNPAGILVGPGAHIDTAGFVASTLNVRNEDFLAGRLTFGGNANAGSIVNQGSITTPAGGSVYLIAPNVGNEGIITTPNGETILAAGQTVNLIDTGTPGVKVEITGTEGNATNLGSIAAAAGRIGMAGVLVRNSGTLNASSVVSEGGRVFLKASQDTYVDKDGRIVATGTKGGSVDVLGSRVAVTDNAAIDASGANGGGSVRVGGDYQGKNPEIQNSTITYFGPQASIKANATDIGDGGRIVVWADDTTRAYGSISAKGGANGGDGGFVETSGHRHLDVNGIKIVTGNGTWLLDPNDISIIHATDSSSDANINGSSPFAPTADTANSTLSDFTINNALPSNDVVITTAATGSAGSGDIVVKPSVAIHTAATPHSLTLNAYRDIVLGDGTTGSVTFSDAAYPLTVNLNAGTGGTGAVSTTATTTVTLSGTSSININGGKTWNNYGTVSLQGSSSYIDLDPGNTGTTLATFNNKSGGTIILNSGQGWALQSNGTAQNATVNNDGLIDVQTGTAIEAAFNQGTSGSLRVSNGANLNLQNAQNISGAINLKPGATAGSLSVNERHGVDASFTNVTFNPAGGTVYVDGTVGTPTASFSAVDGHGIALNVGTGNSGVMKVSGNTTFDSVTIGSGGSLASMDNALLTIGSGDFSVPAGVAYSGANVVGYIAGGGNLTVANPITKSNDAGSSSLLLAASGSVIVSAPIASTTGYPLNVTLQAHRASDTAAGNVQVTSSITTYGGNVTIGGGLDPTLTPAIGYGTASSAQRYGVYIDTATISTGAGNIGIRGQGIDYSGGDLNGINLGANAALLTTGGNISLIGKAGNAGNASSNVVSTNTTGVFIAGSAQATTTGAITIQGTGGDGQTNSVGVKVNGGSVSVTDGGLSITGQGGNAGAASYNNHGLYVRLGATISSSGSGNITLNGTGGTGVDTNEGVFLSGTGTAVSSTNSGNIAITGHGAGSGVNNRGLEVSNGPVISSTGTGTITLSGTGGAGTNNNDGFYIGTTGTGTAAVQSVDGAISITGVGGGAGTNNIGIEIKNNGVVQATGTASITLDGTGSAGTDNNQGVAMYSTAIAGTKVQSATGPVSITGKGQGSGTANYGVYIYDGASVGATGAAAITLDGRGAGSAQGIYTSTATTSNIIGGTSSPNVTLIADTASGTDSISLSGSTLQGAGNLYLKPLTAATTIGLAGSAGTFNLDSTDLGVIQSGFSNVTIGRSDGTGAINVGAYSGWNTSVNLLNAGGNTTTNGGITVSGTTQVTGDLNLTSGGPIAIATGGAINTTHGAVTLVADSITLGDTVTAGTTGGYAVTLRPATLSTAIKVGGAAANSAGTLGLSNTALAKLTATGLTIGSASAGDIEVLAAGATVPATVLGSTKLVTGGKIDVNGALQTAAAATKLFLDSVGNQTLNAAVSAPGLVYLHTGSGTIGQGASGTITTSNLALSTAGSVDLSSAPNSVAYLAANVGGSSFKFRNDSSALYLTKDSDGSMNGVMGTTVGGTGTLSLNAAGAVTQDPAQLAAINASNVELVGTGSFALDNTYNNVGTVAANVQNSIHTADAVKFVSGSKALSIGTVNSTSGISSSYGNVSISTQDQSLIVNAPVSNNDPAGAVTLSTNAISGSGSGITGTGLITANAINLQPNSYGPIGTVGTPLNTSAIGAGTTTFAIGSGWPSSVYINHTGKANVGGTLGANAPFSFAATGDVTITSSFDTGASNLSINSGVGTLTVNGGTTLNGANITLTADRMKLQGAANSITVGTGTLGLKPYSAGRNIDLGSATDLANALELSTTELDTLGGTGTLRIGTLAAGNINLSGPVTPAAFGSGTLSLESGGTITQATAADIITANKLAIKALGNVTLDTAPNVVTNLAAQIGDGSHQNNNFKLKSSNALNIGSNLDGVSGISTNINGTFNSAAPDGVIALTSSGALTQSATATLGGKAVYAEGSRVILTEANPTGVIAGKATGNAPGDIFSYTSSSGINVTTVNGFAGIQTGSPTDTATVLLSAGPAGIGQDTNASINAGAGTKGLQLTTTGPVNLAAVITPNNVVALETTGTGASAPSQINFRNGSGMTIGTANGIATNNGSVNITSASGLLTVKYPINAGTNWVALEAPNIQLGAAGATGTTITGSLIKLRANQPGTGTISSAGTSTSTINSSGIALEADNFSFAAQPPTFNATSDINYRTFSDNGNISVTALGNATNSAPWLVIGNDVATDTDTTGNLTVDATINRAGQGLVLLAGGSITQSAGTITATNLALHAGTVTGSAGASLSNANQVATLAGTTQGGAISFTNAAALNLGTVPMAAHPQTGLTSSGGTVNVTASTGNITVQQGINAGAGGAVTLTATSGAIAEGGTAPIVGASLNASASGGIGHGTPLVTQVSNFSATNTGANTDIQIVNTGVLSLGSISNGTNTYGGKINIDNTGALTTTSLIHAYGGNVALTAHSPLTVGSGGITANNIALAAGGPTWVTGKTGDDLTINGPLALNSTGTITLTAGNTISGSNVPTSSGGTTVTSTLNLNPPPTTPPPPPPPTVGACVANPTLSGCSAVLPSLTTCTTAPTTAGCSVVLPTLATCTTNPTAAGCSAVLPSLASCTTAPTTAGCSAVLPTLATCTTNPTAAGCSAVLPTLAACTTAPTTAGCSAVLPTLATCTTNPTAAGCSAVLPSLASCTTAPTTAGCSVVLPTFASCMTNPTAAGCSAVLPSLAICTTAPTTAGCSVVLPTLATCTTNPTAAGCSVVLPSLATCTTAPTTAGCSAVLPTLAACTTNPTAAGCSVVLPSLASCTAAPTIPGCSVVLPTLAACTTNPTAAGCSVVLPSLASCTAVPTIAGCSAVLPTLASCTTNPTAAGCSVVLPSLASCVATPTLTGCSAVLPSLASCTAAPTTAGCSAVLPTLASCTTNPNAAGCSVVLPTLASCTAAPTTAGCSVVLPTLASCTTNPTAAGCSAVLPSLASCTAAPTTAGCSVVLPTFASCMTNPTAAGCSAVLPSLASCTAAPTTAGCSVVLPTFASCMTNPTAAGCSVVLPSLASCTTAPTTAGCSVVLPTLATCTTNPTAAGCSVVLPSLASCTTAPTTAGCSAVLPTLATCTTNPTAAGCSVVLPSLASCTTAPTTAGCSAVLPTLATCTTNPTAAGCSAVLPSLASCTTAPTTAGCSVVLPTLAACTTNPTAAGCSAVLPSLATCTTAPTTAGCSVVLPTLATCTTNPTAAGCSVVLPSLASCTAAPTIPGCSVVLPTLATCTTNPTAAGCSVVLPSLASCTAAPTIPGCSVVLPTLAACTTNPTAAGCSVVLPSLASCTAIPTTAGCAAVLPTLAACTANPAAAGCSVVLPSLASCTAVPTTAGCSAVLPTLASCTANPAAAGCSVVLPSLASCTAIPTTAGCSAVLPTLASCTANPAAAGCSVVLPSLASCTAAPTIAGCSAVLPTLATCSTDPAAAGCSAVLPVVATTITTTVTTSTNEVVAVTQAASTPAKETTAPPAPAPVIPPVASGGTTGISLLNTNLTIGGTEGTFGGSPAMTVTTASIGTTSLGTAPTGTTPTTAASGGTSGTAASGTSASSGSSSSDSDKPAGTKSSSSTKKDDEKKEDKKEEATAKKPEDKPAAKKPAVCS